MQLGGRIPHGVLLYGPPGTGKTLLARAVAGEAHAAYFSIAASEFIEAIVGVGASRVRDLFSKAKEAAPSIIFIDELDAIGRSRQGGSALSGANDEREQTLDQILTEMDGFESDQARRRARRHQPARDPRRRPAAPRTFRSPRRGPAARPRRPTAGSSMCTRGRFPSPRTLTSTAWPRPHPAWSAPTWPTSPTRRRCCAARRGHDKVHMADFTGSLDKILLGAPRGILLLPTDRERTAYHESGHALVGMLTPDADPVRKVSIIPRGMALGVTLSTPDGDRVSYPREELEAQIKVSLGGRVGRGGRVRHDHHRRGVRPRAAQPDRPPDGRPLGHEREARPDRAAPARWAGTASRERASLAADAVAVDEEVQRIVDDAHCAVTQLLTDHRGSSTASQHALLAAETLDAPEAYAAAGVPMRGAELAGTTIA